MIDDLDPPRRCVHCNRRMVVQVMPTGWTATCSRHGRIGSATTISSSTAVDGSSSTAVDGSLQAKSSDEQLLATDRRQVWHPYAPMAGPATGPAVELAAASIPESIPASMPESMPASIPRSSPRLVRSAAGVRLQIRDHDGSELTVLDAMSSWWCAIHGYRHPALDQAAHAQVDRMSHVMFGGLTHEPAIRLVSQLVALTPDPLQHVFLADSGSVSVEVAIKMCLQYQRGRGRPGRRRLLTVRGGYHGDTFAAMSVCDPVNGMHAMFTGTLAEQVFVPRPPAGFDRPPDDPAIIAWAEQVRQTATDYRDELAAIIVEPILQGAGGMYMYSPACLRVLRSVADDHDLLLVHDEIATGFGRTGTWWASQHVNTHPVQPTDTADPADPTNQPTVPDILCVGKALTGGYLSLAAVICSTAVAAGVDAAESGVLAHGPTFMGNPLACAVASANLDLLSRGDWQRQVTRIGHLLTEGLQPCRELPQVLDVRVLGAVGVVQLDQPVDVAGATAAALHEGVWIRPFRDLIYTMPPYISTDNDVRTIARGINAAVTASASASTAPEATAETSADGGASPTSRQ